MRPYGASAAAAALIASAALSLGACDSIRSVFTAEGGAGDAADPEPSAVASFQSQGEGGGDQVPERGEREVEFPAVAESVAASLFPDDGAAFAGASVPVLAPASMSREQAAGFLSSYRTTPDGYFAQLGLEKYDVVVNGTRMFAVAPEAAGAPTRDTTEYMFSETDTGLMVTFSRFGADYTLDFICRGPGDEAGMDCVTEAEAAELVERLVPVGGGGR